MIIRKGVPTAFYMYYDLFILLIYVSCCPLSKRYIHTLKFKQTISTVIV